jgi:SAM-dependent methyltransferase
MKNVPISRSPAAPSPWVERWAPLIRPGGLVLDLAAGAGRHVQLLLDRGFAVRAVDCDASALLPLVGPSCEIIETDLESGADRALGGGYDGIVVTNYLPRPLLPAIGQALAPGGVVIYETFAVGNESFGRPQNPDFLLRPSELLLASAVAFEQGLVTEPRPAVIQHIAAVAGPLGRYRKSYLTITGGFSVSVKRGNLLRRATRPPEDARHDSGAQKAGRGRATAPCA